MDIFNLNTPEENKDDKLDTWFDFMNQQFEKLEQARKTHEINKILFDNDIDLI